MGNTAGVDLNANVESVSWADYDGDGDQDLYVSARSSANKLYQNNGSGSFTDVANAPINSATDDLGAAWGDYDNDGDLDLYMGVNGAANKLFRNDGGGTFTDQATAAGVASTSPTVAVAWGDYDNDGDLDLYITVSGGGGANIFYENDGDGTFTDKTTASGLTDTGGGRTTAWADYDNDGDLDLMLANFGANSTLFQNDGDLTFTASSAPGGAHAVTWGDYDNDGDLEIYITHHAGVNSLFRNDGSGTFLEVAATAGVADISGLAYGAGWADYDNDGDLDLAVVNSGFADRLFSNGGSGTFTEVATTAGLGDTGTGRGMAWADYDGDGDMDLYVATATGETNLLYKNNGNTNKWLHVKLTGVANNRSAIGTVVTAVTGATRQVRQVSGGDGYQSQGSLTVEFGFGSTTTVDSLIVEWADGLRQFLTNVATNQVLSLTETIPTITSFTPTSGNVGSSITITGTNFAATAANNTVFFDPIEATVTAASATSLTVTVPTGAGFGPISVTVANRTVTSTQFFLPTYSGLDQTVTTGLLSEGISLTAGTTLNDVAFGDIDGDGNPDIVVVNFGDNNVSVYRNLGTTGGINGSSFAAKFDFPTGTGPHSVAIGDLDRDGKLDLAVSNVTANTVSVLRNTATSGVINAGSFAAKQDFVVGTSPRTLAIGDLDGDAKPDIVTPDLTANTVSVLRNTSTPGTIFANSFATSVTFTTGTGPNWVSIGDLDGDGEPDLAVTNGSGGNVSVFHNTSTAGSITFATKVDFTTGVSPVNVAIADLDGDGKLDLSVSNITPNTVSVLHNTSTSGVINTSTFATAFDFTTGTGPAEVAVGDLDGDGKPELVVENQTANTLSVFKNTSTSGTINVGSFSTKVDFPTGTTPLFLAVGDLDGDGRPEVATATQTGNTVSIHHNIADPPTITSFTPTSGVVGASVTITGTNFDATPGNNTVFFDPIEATVTAASATSLTVTVPSGAGFGPISVTVSNRTAISDDFFLSTYTGLDQTIAAGTLAQKVDFTSGTAPLIVAVGDIDGDGKPDLVTANNAVGTISVLHNTSATGAVTASSYAAKVDFTAGTNPIDIAIGDMDGDGKPDIAVANGGSDNVSVFRNTSSGSVSLATAVNFTTGAGPGGVALGDLDGDGKPDLAVTNVTDNTVSVFRNTSTSGSITTSSFAAKVDFPTGTDPRGVRIGDLDGDGLPEIATANSTGNSVSVLRNTSTPGTITTSSFAVKVDLPTNTFPRLLTIGDIDGDGVIDIAAANVSSDNVSVLRNMSTVGTISFDGKVDFPTSIGPIGIGLGDVDGDGKPDIVAANNTANTVSVLRNTSVSGTVSFAGKVDVTAATGPWGVSIVDLDGDGRPELAVGNFEGGVATKVSVFHNIADPPTITAFTPTSGVVGSSVTITGHQLRRHTGE